MFGPSHASIILGSPCDCRGNMPCVYARLCVVVVIVALVVVATMVIVWEGTWTSANLDCAYREELV